MCVPKLLYDLCVFCHVLLCVFCLNVYASIQILRGATPRTGLDQRDLRMMTMCHMSLLRSENSRW